MRIHLLICFFLAAGTLHAQSTFSKVNIGGSGCAFYAPGDPLIDSFYSDDSSIVYAGESELDSLHYFIICVQLKDKVEGENEQVLFLEQYMDLMKNNFGVVAAVGYGRGHTLDDNPAAHGIIDFWEDEFGDSWSVMGWIDGRYLAILGVYGPPTNRNTTRESFYMNGFRFPGM